MFITGPRQNRSGEHQHRLLSIGIHPSMSRKRTRSYLNTLSCFITGYRRHSVVGSKSLAEYEQEYTGSMPDMVSAFRGEDQRLSVCTRSYLASWR